MSVHQLVEARNAARSVPGLDELMDGHSASVR